MQMLGYAYKALFAGEPPILFDEWQLEPTIWNRVRRRLTTAAGPASSFSPARQRAVSLAALMSGTRQTGDGTSLTYNELLQRIVIGRWPAPARKG